MQWGSQNILGVAPKGDRPLQSGSLTVEAPWPFCCHWYCIYTWSSLESCLPFTLELFLIQTCCNKISTNKKKGIVWRWTPKRSKLLITLCCTSLQLYAQINMDRKLIWERTEVELHQLLIPLGFAVCKGRRVLLQELCIRKPDLETQLL